MIYEFNLKDYWNYRYSNLNIYKDGMGSGIGSSGGEVDFKSIYVNEKIAEYGIKTIVEYGCGSGMFLSLCDGYDKYIGYDISDKAIQLAKNRFGNDDNKSLTSDIDDIDISYELALSLDVIFHQVNDDDYFKYLHNLFRHKYVIIYSTSHNNNTNAPKHIRHHDFINDCSMFGNHKIIDRVYGYPLNIHPNDKEFVMYKRET